MIGFRYAELLVTMQFNDEFRGMVSTGANSE
jgi:hypothetical protein